MTEINTSTHGNKPMKALCIEDIYHAIEALKNYTPPSYSPIDHFYVNCPWEELKSFFSRNGIAITNSPNLVSQLYGFSIIQNDKIPKNEMRMIDSLGFIKCRIIIK